MKKPPQRTTVLFLRDIPVDLKDTFKAWCARRGFSMTAVLRDYMREKVTEDVSKEQPNK